MHNSVGHPYCCHPVSNLSSFLGQSYLGCMRREFSQKYNWWESVFLSRLEHTPVICTHFQSRGWICPVGKSSKPISVQMQIILTNYSINTPQIAILCEVNGSYLSNKEAEKHKLDHVRGADWFWSRRSASSPWPAHPSYIEPQRKLVVSGLAWDL